jgi:dolichol-phosphate mannosyltransferase
MRRVGTGQTHLAAGLLKSCCCDYPKLKLFLNSLANYFLKILFRSKLNDTTNAFKAYRKEVIDRCRPLIAPHFNITVELPLKAIVRGFTWTTIPITWRNRRTGVAKLKIKEMGSRYLFICLYVWLEKYFSAGDYRRGQVGRSADANTQQERHVSIKSGL